MAFIGGREVKLHHISADISDLFFNTDHGVLITHEQLQDDAGMFLASLGRLGVSDLPRAEDLIADFYRRV